MISVDAVLSAVSDTKSLALFNDIATTRDNGIDTMQLFAAERHISRKQYYTRLSCLTNIGLVKRNNRRYSLTGLGKIVYDAIENIEQAVKNHSKLVAIDCIANYEMIPNDIRISIIDTLFSGPKKNNNRIRLLLTSQLEADKDCEMDFHNNNKKNIIRSAVHGNASQLLESE